MTGVAELEAGAAFTKQVWRAYLSQRNLGETAGVLHRFPEVKQDFLDALGDLANQIERDIKVCTDSHYPVSVDEKLDKFEDDKYRTVYLHIFAPPKEANVTGAYELPENIKLCGNEYTLRGCQRDYLTYDLAPLNMMAVKTEPDAQGMGYNLAVFRGHHIYLVADLFDCQGGGWEREATETEEEYKDRTGDYAVDSCQLVIEILTASLGWLVENNQLISFEEYEKKRIEQQYEEYKKLYSILKKGAMRGAKNDYDDAVAQITRLQEELQKYWEKRRKAELTIHGVENGYNEVSVVGNENMFNNLMQHYYESVKIIDDVFIEAVTRTIYIKEVVPVDYEAVANLHPGSTDYRKMDVETRMGIFKIGKLKLTIPIKRGSITAVALDPVPASNKYCQTATGVIYHPHVRGEDGADICWGNMRNVIPKLRSENNIMVLLQVMGQFFFSYNPGDAYNRVWMWPEVTPEDGFTEDDLVYDSSKDKDAALKGDGALVEIVRRQEDERREAEPANADD